MNPCETVSQLSTVAIDLVDYYSLQGLFFFHNKGLDFIRRISKLILSSPTSEIFLWKEVIYYGKNQNATLRRWNRNIGRMLCRIYSKMQGKKPIRQDTWNLRGKILNISKVP